MVWLTVLEYELQLYQSSKICSASFSTPYSHLTPPWAPRGVRSRRGNEKEGSEVSNDLNLYINTSTGFKIKPIVTSQACQHLKTLL